MDKILITGSTGYLGACILTLLRSQGNFEIDTLKGRLEDIEPKTLEYDLVIHSAAALRYRKNQQIDSNENGTRKEPTKIVYISSKSVYGTKRNGVLNEESTLLPDEEYGITKRNGEVDIISSQMPYLILRSSTLFGLGIDNLGSAFPSTATKKLVFGNKINLFTPDVNHEYLYVKDLANIVVRLIEKNERWNNIYNVSGPTHSLFSLFKEIEEQLKSKSITPDVINKVHHIKPDQFFLDTSKLENMLGANIYTPTGKIVDEMLSYILFMDRANK